MAKLHISTVRLCDAHALSDFLRAIPNSDGLEALLSTRAPLNTRAFDDDNQVARFVIGDGSVVNCFTVSEITIDQAELITRTCEDADAWDEASFQQALTGVVGGTS